MDTDSDYPILSGGDDDAEMTQCVVCKRSCGEPGNFLQLCAGAILHADESRQSGGPDELMSAYLHIAKHGAEPDGPYISLPIVQDLQGGQADLLFCSAACLRAFFSSAVDELERRWLCE